MKPVTQVSVLVLAGVALGPFALGYVIARWIPGIWTWSPTFWGLAFLAVWFVVGRSLGRKGYGTAALMAGIVPAILGMGIFVQRFFLTSCDQRCPRFLSLVGQLYPMVAVVPATQAMRTLGILDSRIALLYAYALVMGAFTVGFLSGRNTSRE